MKFLSLLFAFWLLQPFTAKSQAPETLPTDTLGLHISSATLATVGPTQAQTGYIVTKRKRIRNRVLQTLSLNYAPLSFVTGWYLDPFKAKDKPYILHADMIPQFSIGGEWSPFPVLITPRYRVRIFGNDPAAGDISSPVRTPSYMPGATVFLPLQQLLTEETEWVRFASLSVFHHSNGQDGPAFDSPGKLNKYNGSFSTNFVEPAVWVRKRTGGGAPDTPAYAGARYPYCDMFLRIGYEQHFNTDPNLAPSYGRSRMNLNLGWIHVSQYNDIHPASGTPFNKPYYRELFRVLFNATLIAGGRTLGLNAASKRINAEGSFNYRIPGSPNTALMGMVGYYGSDPYNIYYGDSYFYVRIGLAAGLFVAPSRENLH